MEKPIYEHDCEECKFLGVYDNHDLYVCNNEIVARYGENPWNYKSCHVDATIPDNSILIEARRRAIGRE